mgnify:CR=1 FL=1
MLPQSRSNRYRRRDMCAFGELRRYCSRRGHICRLQAPLSEGLDLEVPRLVLLVIDRKSSAIPNDIPDHIQISSATGTDIRLQELLDVYGA